MYSNKRTIKVALISAFFVASFVSCVKQRPEITSQADQAMQSLQQDAPRMNKSWRALSDNDSYLRKTDHTITTGNVLFPSQNSIAEELRSEPGSGLRFLDVVNFKSTHPLLDGKAEIAYMLGEPNKTYSVVEELTPTHLILFKVVADDELSFNEQTIALRYEGKWRVPVGGYQVNYFRRERVKNEDNRDTNIAAYIPVPAQDYKQATDFRVDRNNFIPFERFVKSDVLPKTFFDGEWYFTETTVETRYDNSNAVGDLGGSDSNFSSATRIKFRIFDDQIVGLNTNVDEDFKDDPNSLNYNTVIKIQVDHRDFNWIRMGAQTLKEIEEEVKDKEAKRYIRLHYLESETPQTTLEGIFASIFGRINNFRNVLDVTYGKDYFSYSIRDAQSGTIKRYSMRKIDAKSQMAPRQAFKDDNRIFGTFVATRYKKLDYKVARQSDIENLLIMARHNPKKDIVYYFTTNTPKDKWFRDIGRASIDLWNQAFKKAGLKINIRLDESKDVALGDIRYNVLNIVDRAGAGLLGFGPSLIDSETGEIVSASMNTGVDNIIRQMYGVVRDYLGRKSGIHYNFKQDTQSTEMPHVLKMIAQINAGLYSVDPKSGEMVLDGRTELNPAIFTDSEKEFLRYFDLSPDMKIRDLVEKVSELRVHSYRYANLGGPFNVSMFGSQDSALTSSTEVLDEVIEKNCKEVVSLAKALSENPLITTPEEMKIIDPCVRLLAQGEAVLTTVHELGHNLSLRHNFRGSVDKDNYPKIEDYRLNYVKLADGVARPMSSSIMEYVTNEGQQVMPGKYDLAAIRWIYNEEVETKDGRVVKVDTKKRIEDNVGSVENLKRYQFCTDEHRILVTDALCYAFDKGTTVKETVRFQIEQLYNTMNWTYRFDRITPGSPFLALWLGQGRSLKAKYDEWRGFLRRYTGTNKSYLQGYDLNSYNALIKSIKARGGKEAADLKEHLEVRNMIVRFLVDVAFISNKYCVVLSNNEEKLVELEKIRKELFGIRDFSEIKSCKSPSAQKYMEERGYKLVREFGHFLDPGQFNQDPSRRLEPLDFVGTGLLRGFAMYHLTVRDAPSINNQIEGFFPSMLDEPDIRFYVQFLILDRLINGVRVAHDNSKSEYANPKDDLFGPAEVEKISQLKAYINFNNEAPLIQQFTEIMAMNLWMPGAQDDGRRGNVNVSVGDPSQIENIKAVAGDYIEYLDSVLYVRSRDSFAGQVIARFKQLNQQKGLMTIDPQTIQGFKENLLNSLDKSGVLFVPPKKHITRDFINLVLALDSFLQQLSQDPNAQPVIFVISRIFEPEFNLFSGLLQHLQSQGLTFEQLMAFDKSANPEEKAKADQIMLIPMESQYAELKKDYPGISLPTSGEMRSRYAKLIAEHTEAYNNYTNHVEELDSQIDLLQRIVQVLSR